MVRSQLACCLSFLALVAATPLAQANLLSNGDFEGAAIVTSYTFDQNDLGFWQGPGTGWASADDGSGSNTVADRVDGFTDLLAQAISGAGITQDLTLTFDLVSTDEAEGAPADPTDNNALAAKVFGVPSPTFNFDVAGGFDPDFANDTPGFVELGSVVVDLANQVTFAETVTLAVDIDASGGTPPYSYIAVVFAGGFGTTNDTPATSSIQIDNVSLTAVPEPASLMLIAAGSCLIARRSRRTIH